MAIFSRKQPQQSYPQVESIDCVLNLDWFRTWTSDILDGADVQHSEENLAGLSAKAVFCLVLTGKSLMDQNDAGWAKSQLDAFVDSSEASPWAVAGFIAGWDDRSLPLLESELKKFAGMLIETGRETKSFRHDW